MDEPNFTGINALYLIFLSHKGLKYFPDQKLNIRQIENLDTKSVLRVRDLLRLINVAKGKC